jgi:hypothetical protein
MISDEQFEKLLEKISINQTDRERLIRIETIVSLNRDSSEKCKIDVASKMEALRMTANKAHERIDDEQKARFIFTGILLAIASVGSITAIILKLTGKL